MNDVVCVRPFDFEFFFFFLLILAQRFSCTCLLAGFRNICLASRSRYFSATLTGLLSVTGTLRVKRVVVRTGSFTLVGALAFVA